MQKSKAETKKTDTPSVVQNAQPKRLFKDDIKVYHDLFKLKTATMLKNMSFDIKKKSMVPVEHVHFFHTYDSNGKKMDRSNNVGGHFHKMEVYEENGQLKVKCSKPYTTKMRVNELGARVLVEVQADDDHHVHDCEYIRSETVQVKPRNVDAQMMFNKLTKVQ